MEEKYKKRQVIADAGLDFKMYSEGLWGNRKCRAGCGLFNIREAGWYLLACILSERSVHNLVVSLHVFFRPGMSSCAHSPVASRETIYQQ